MYEGQDIKGSNEHGCPLVNQTCADAVQGFDELLASLGFSSVEEMIAAAQD